MYGTDSYQGSHKNKVALGNVRRQFPKKNISDNPLGINMLVQQTMIRNLILLALFTELPLTISAQIKISHLSDSAKVAEYREKICLDYSMPDFSVSSIDEGKMGSRLASLLHFYEEVNNQDTYIRWIGTILKEQYEAFEHSYAEVKKQKLAKAYKLGNEITVIYKLWLDKNRANLKQVEIRYHFKDGVSESCTVNDMFSHISHYVQERELINK